VAGATLLDGEIGHDAFEPAALERVDDMQDAQRVGVSGSVGHRRIAIGESGVA
jgi:hypothetical protein